MMLARENAISLVATCWLMAIFVGAQPVLVIGIGLPCIVIATVVYVRELKRRYRRRR